MKMGGRVGMHSSKRLTLREVPFREKVKSGHGSLPYHTDKGPRGRALCAGGQAIGSYGTSAYVEERPDTERHAPPQEVNLEEGPRLEKARTKEPEERTGAKRAGVGPEACMEMSWPEHVVDDSIMRKLLPELRKDRYIVRGNRINPEPPRLVAKVCEEKGEGELWLGPLPTARRTEVITETKHSIQIYCFAKNLEAVKVDDSPGESGMRIPGALVFRCEMPNPNATTRQQTQP